ncbi:MAG: chemosensory pili system protein ChpC [Gammaproteobacteria bacterium]|jgi:chemosensory pili system protein ChpC
MVDDNSSIRCMILPLASINLVVPNSAVAEIIGYSTLLKLADSSDWFGGVVLWRGVFVPVVAIEEMCAIDRALTGPRARIAILYNLNKDEDLPYIGIHMQDIPRAYLAESGRMASGSNENLGKYLLSHVDEEHFARAIPNFETIISDLKLELSDEKIEQATH